ncbi:MAG: hypothetical protein L0Y36_05415 [Planctomycetales bacterium]|nr:hypothetical protein [Planctomycetales bacterium]
MKESPQEKMLEEALRSSKLVAGGFMGTDSRHPARVIDEDWEQLQKCGFTPAQTARRMQELTDLAAPGLGNWLEAVPGRLQVKSEDFKGALVCPWSHPGLFAKRITTARRMDTGDQIVWTDLNLHMIAEHGFFEGRGAFFRIEPADIVRILFEGLT